MPTYSFPSNAELREIEQDYIANNTLDDPIFQEFPIVTRDADKLIWDIMDNFYGMQAARGLNGEPQAASRPGSKQWEADPGYYGEFDIIDEATLTRKRQLGTWGDPIDLSDEVNRIHAFLNARWITRLRANLWTLLQSGSLSVFSGAGALIHKLTYAIQTYTASVPWATVATATPLQNMRAVQLLNRGYGVRFDATATAYANQTTINSLLNNTNASDLGGKRIENGSTFNDLASVNRVLAANNLPQFVPMDDGYHTAIGSTGTTNFTKHIMDAVVVVVGKRQSGVKLGEYQMTRNANNPDLSPGSHIIVTDSLDAGKAVPRAIRVDYGHNGGAVLEYPSGVVAMSV